MGVPFRTAGGNFVPEGTKYQPPVQGRTETERGNSKIRSTWVSLFFRMVEVAPIDNTISVEKTESFLPVNKRSRNWCITDFSAPDNITHLIYYKDKLKSIGKTKYFILGMLEKCPETGRLHRHYFVQFINDTSLKSLKSIFGDGQHFEIKARGSTPEQCRDYCIKSDLMPKNEQVWYEYGQLVSNDLKRKKGGEAEIQIWKNAKKCAISGDFLNIDDQILICHYGSLKSLHKDFMKRRPNLVAPCGFWIVGAPGCGKSRGVRNWAKMRNLEVYPKMMNKWFDNYAMEPIILLEDPTPESCKCLYQQLLLWADCYEFIAEAKGCAIRIRPLKVIVTSNYTISDCFPGDENDEHGGGTSMGVRYTAIARRYKSHVMTLEGEKALYEFLDSGHNEYELPDKFIPITPIDFSDDCSESSE